MKNRFLIIGSLICVLIFGMGKTVSAQTLSLDAAIRAAAGEISTHLDRGSKIAVLSMRSDSLRMSNYLLEELISAMVSHRTLTVVDRAQLELVQQELTFNVSGDVSDASAQAIGQMLGAQAIATGSFDNIGSLYRFRVRVILVETAAIQATYSANIQNDQIVASLMGAVHIPVTVPSGSSVPSGPSGTYQVGDTGPAGGIIFFDKGSFGDGWRYLEVAPAWVDTTAEWGSRGNDIPGTSTAVGSGKRNTQLIVEQLNQRGERQRAAQICASLEINGFQDWFLPSRDELNLLFQNRLRVGNLQEARYWSSSQHSRTSALAQNFNNNGRQSDHNKFDNYRVRPVRAF
ncbi:MAG: DUF1566 domain-containing protein [Treponema sp.]|nr:DUF1566 domain-containing protein [Treponema sp.]